MQLRNERKRKSCHITAKAAFKFRSEAWILKKREEQRLEAAQMKFLRHLLGITKLDKEKNQCIRQTKNGSTEYSKGNKTVPEKLATTCTEDGHKQTIKSGYNMYRGWTQTDYQKWLQHVQRMDTNILPKQALQYKPKGRRNKGRPRKRWRDQLHLEDQGTGNTPNPSGNMTMMRNDLFYPKTKFYITKTLHANKRHCTLTSFEPVRAHFSTLKMAVACF